MKAPIIAVLLALASSAPVVAATFVYVSNAEDGDIGMYTLQADGSLQPGQCFGVEKLVMPMAVTPDKRLLIAPVIIYLGSPAPLCAIAALPSKPFHVHGYSIERSTGARRYTFAGNPCGS